MSLIRSAVLGYDGDPVSDRAGSRTVTWLSIDAWIDACGALAEGLRRPYVPRGGEGALMEAVFADPRRLTALVGEPGSGASRLALEIARRAPVAYYLDPVPPPDRERAVAELARLLAPVSADDRPVVVLDGPDPEESLLPLAELLSHRLHPRLLVVVPCNRRKAQHLAHIAGGYPRMSISVVAVLGEGTPPPPVPGLASFVALHDALIPFALAGRCPAGRLAREETLVGMRLVARDAASGTALCLLDDRNRFALVERAILSAPDGRARLEQMLSEHPWLLSAAVANVLRWAGGLIPVEFADVLLAFRSSDFPDVTDYARRGILVSPEVFEKLSERATALLAEARDDDCAAALEQHLARSASARGDSEQAAKILRSALDREIGARRRSGLLEMLAVIGGAPELYARAATSFRECEDWRGLSRVLRRWTRKLQGTGQPDEAVARVTELIELEQTRGNAAGAAAALTLAASVVGDLDAEAACEYVERAGQNHQAIGQVRGQVLALYRIASHRVDLDQAERAEVAIEEALRLEEAIDNRQGEAYCHYMLGGLADKRADRATASKHYAAAIKAHEAEGLEVPERLRQALETARSATAERRTAPDEEPGEEPGAAGFPEPHGEEES